MSDLPTPNFQLVAVAGLLRWTAEFSETIEPARRIEMRMGILRFVAQGFPSRDPGFDLEPLTRGEQPAGAPDGGVTLVSLIQAFRFFDENRDPRGIDASRLIWHLIANPRASVLERA